MASTETEGTALDQYLIKSKLTVVCKCVGLVREVKDAY
jgi:hypothetical protein